MDLIIDNDFKNSYNLYFGGQTEEKIFESINNVFINYDPELVADTINIIKTSMTLGFTYSKCYNKITEKVLSKFPLGDDIDKFIMCLVIKIMIVAGVSSIYDLLSTSRNINKEVTAKHFRVPIKKVTEDMISQVLKASNSFIEGNYNTFVAKVESWDDYFYTMCCQVARNSKCFSKSIGAVLVKDKVIVSTGYNGPPRGVPKCDIRWRLDKEFLNKYKDKIVDKQIDGVCPRRVLGYKSGEGLEICVAGHAERNALINAAREGISTKGAILYMSCGIPCTPCLVEIINSGIKEIVVTSLKTYDESAMYLLQQSSLGIRMYDFIK